MHAYYLYYNIFIITFFIIICFFFLQWKFFSCIHHFFIALFLFFLCSTTLFLFDQIVNHQDKSFQKKLFAALHHTLEWLLSQGLFKTNKQLVKNVQKRRTSWQFYKWKRKVESEITQKSRKWQSMPAGTSCLLLGALTIKTFDLALSTYTENKHCFSQLQEHHK